MPSGQFEDLTGRRYGRLTVREVTKKRLAGTHVVWLCDCDCGGQTLATTANLNSGNTLSCGCLQRDISHLPDADRSRWSELIDPNRGE